MKKLFLNISVISALTAANAAAQISVGVTGTTGTQTFDTRPPATQWSTTNIAGGAGDATTAAALDFAATALAASGITTQTADLGTANPPGTNTNAVWTAGGSKYLQTCPTTVKATILMATLKNDFGAAQSTLNVQLTRTVVNYVLTNEQVLGWRAFYSLSGAASSWVAIPEFNEGVTANGSATLTATLAFATPWATGTNLYIMFADDNGSGSPDWSLQLDDFVASFPSGPCSSVSDTDWNTPATWNTNAVPNALSAATVTHAVTVGSAAATCNTLAVSGSGSVTVTGQSLSVIGSGINALNTTGGALSLDATSTLNVPKATTSASFAGLSVATYATLNITSELTVDSSKDISGTTLTTPKLTLAGGTLTKNDGLSMSGSGKVISGNGGIASSVTLGTGAKINPGTDATIASISMGGLTLGAGTFLMINATDISTLDQIKDIGTGGLTIDGGAITFLKGDGSGPVTTIGAYPIILYAGGAIGGSVSNLSVANPVPGLRYSFTDTGSSVVLDVTQGPLWSGPDGGVWSDSANWSGVSPGASDTLVYSAPGKSGASVNDLVAASFPSIQFETGMSAFTLSNNKVVLTGDLNGAVVVNNSSNIQTLNLPVQINSPATVNTNTGAVVLGNEVSGAGTLLKIGTSALTLSGTNIYSGGTTLSAGTLNINSATALGATAGVFTIAGGTLNASAGDIVLSNNNPITWTGDFTFTGSNNLNLGSGAVTMTGNRTATVSAKSLTLGGTVTGSGILTKRGVGTLVLGAAGSAVGKAQVYGGGTLQVASGASLTTTQTLDITKVSTLRVTSGAFTCAAADEAHDGQKANVIVEGAGSTLTTNGEWLMGRNTGAGSLIVKDNGIVNGGVNPLRMGRDNIRDNYVSLRNSAQATFGSVIVFDSSYYGEGGQGSGSVLEVLDSASLTTGSMTVANFLGNNNTVHPRYGTGQVYQAGGTVTVNGNISMGVEVSLAGDVITGTYNLNGGVLKTKQINNGAATIRGTANMNFHGGTLTSNNTTAQTDYIKLGATGSLYIYEGATIDDGGQAVTINQPMLTPNAGQGVAAITLATPIGAVNAYSMNPEVLITGGGGTGATAVSVLNGSGQVSGITVTNPGLNYSSTPTVQLFFQGNATTVPAGSITMNTGNAFTGGLTKKGVGKLTLNAANTYTGATVVSAGTLALGASGSLGAASAGVSIAAGATFDVTALTAASATYTWNTSSLNASGTGTDAATAATIVGTAGGTVAMGATPMVLTWAGASAGTDAAHPPLTVTGAALTLGGNPFTVVVPGTALGAGVYTLVSAGTITGSVNPTPLYTGGNGVASGATGVVSISGGNTVILTVTSSGTPYENWASTHAGSQAANLDWDNDGVRNGVEYFMGAPTGFTANPPVVTTAGVRTVTWTRDPGATITSWMVQVSDNLATWADVLPGNPSLNTLDPTKVIYTLPVGTTKFCRLVVTP